MKKKNDTSESRRRGVQFVTAILFVHHPHAAPHLDFGRELVHLGSECVLQTVYSEKKDDVHTPLHTLPSVSEVVETSGVQRVASHASSTATAEAIEGKRCSMSKDSNMAQTNHTSRPETAKTCVQK
mmetsp:Transcript_36891/g.44464  ORF Transcript_36891/g.44464 Transcript_36891/m.44464 type:complete len:126 (+) Transcript_36891:71-448(+)